MLATDLAGNPAALDDLNEISGAGEQAEIEKGTTFKLYFPRTGEPLIQQFRPSSGHPPLHGTSWPHLPTDLVMPGLSSRYRHRLHPRALHPRNPRQQSLRSPDS